ncbi:MAG: transglutaminase domain-containing protein [Verrucomicrobiaceae bacterium]|nr:transglutaminase domain-containing protein [Verrucomicrobiaceae bacterium]
MPGITVHGLEISGKRIPEVHVEGLQSALERAGDNAPQLRAAFGKIKAEEVTGLAFLIANMPERDLVELDAVYLAENITWAYKARARFPWAQAVAEELFFNDVLPYASINERRDAWRKDFFGRFAPLVKGCKTPGEAAQVLNKEIWSIVDVRYHATKRPKPDQSPYESIEAKFASCSGLSVMLIDACRSVGVPARFVGTPMWSNKRGNHSWVEVWDGSDWQYTGACEYNPSGLGKAWFAGSAAKAIKDDPRHAIYASSWKKAETRFPLVWDLEVDYVHAENVTDRYAGKKTRRVFIDLVQRPGGERVAAGVEVFCKGKRIAAGRTRDATNDTNDMFGLTLISGADHELRIVLSDKEVLTRKFRPSGKEDERIEVFVETPR